MNLEGRLAVSFRASPSLLFFVGVKNKNFIKLNRKDTITTSATRA